MNRLILSLSKRIHHIKNMQEYKDLSKQHKNYILNFSAGWCGPCKQMAPILSKKEEQANGKWVLFKVDVDEEGNAELCQSYKLEGVPTMVFFKDNKEIGTVVGALNQSGLDDALSKII